jgi:hypothetical protein
MSLYVGQIPVRDVFGTWYQPRAQGIPDAHEALALKVVAEALADCPETSATES